MYFSCFLNLFYLEQFLNLYFLWPWHFKESFHLFLFCLFCFWYRLMILQRIHVWGKKTAEVILFPSVCTLSGGTCCQHMSWVMVLTSTTWLRSYLPGFYTDFSHWNEVSWAETFWCHENTLFLLIVLSTNFIIYWYCYLTTALIVGFTKEWHSIIPSAFVN